MIDSRWCHWGFFPWLLTEPCALGSTQPLKMSTMDFCWGKGGRCVRLMTYHPRSAERQEIRGLNLPGTPWVCSGLLRETFTFTFYPSILPCHILAMKLFYFHKECAQMTNFKWSMGRIEHRKDRVKGKRNVQITGSISVPQCRNRNKETNDII